MRLHDSSGAHGVRGAGFNTHVADATCARSLSGGRHHIKAAARLHTTNFSSPHARDVSSFSRRKAESQEPEEELTEEEAAARAAEATAAKDVRVKAHLAQQARLELALREGMRIVVDCSFILKSSEREVSARPKWFSKSPRSPSPAHRRGLQLHPQFFRARGEWAARLGMMYFLPSLIHDSRSNGIPAVPASLCASSWTAA